MLFNSLQFLLVFLPATLLVIWAAYTYGGARATRIVLTLLSLAFYGNWRPEGLILLLTSIGVNYALSLHIANNRGRQWAKVCLWAGIAFNISLIVYFKYFNFFIETA